MCFTKYNKEGITYLSVLLVNDEHNCQFGKGGQTDSRKHLIKDKDEVRGLETGKMSPFASRGLILDTPMKID